MQENTANLGSQGIIHQSSCVDPTPKKKQNGVTHSRVARYLKFTTQLPNFLWGEADLTATYIINLMSSRVLMFQTLYHMFLKSFLNTRVLSSLFSIFFDVQCLSTFMLITEPNLILKLSKVYLLGIPQIRRGRNAIP